MSSGQHEIKILDNTVERILHGDMSWWTLDHTNIYKKELSVYKICKKNNIPVPIIISHKPTEFVLSKCEGHDASFDTDDEHFYEIGLMLKKLHSIKITRQIDLPDVSIDVYIPFIQKESFSEKMHQISNKLPHNPNVLIHGDFHPGNIITDNFVTGIIDWEECALGDPNIDVATMVNGIKWYYPDDNVKIINFLNGYGRSMVELLPWFEFLEERNKMIKNWVLKTNKERSINTNIDMWI